MTSPPRARIFAMSGPNVDHVTGLSPFQVISQEPTFGVWRNAIVRYFAPESRLWSAGLASVYAWKYGENTWSGIPRCPPSSAYALTPTTPPAVRIAVAAAAVTSHRDRRGRERDMAANSPQVGRRRAPDRSVRKLS